MTRVADRAWRLLQEARMDFDGRVVGIKASCDDRAPSLNYDQCFVRDFAVCAPAFLLRGEHGIVRDFLITTLSLQSKRQALEALEPREGLMPASFRPVQRDGATALEGDYGEESVARVTPVDSVFWWLLTLRAYCVVT
ncbi:MAG TPA: glycoside hydrolase 100 family protein, partial [Longimicrobiales bacterium]|nr:glycoside hydrolase 100 family protein [Longimicrobiales bacterium]